MKTPLILFFLLLFISLSCQQGNNNAESENADVEVQLSDTTEVEKTTIHLDEMDGHPNKEQMEWMLNNYEEEFVILEKDWKPLEQDSLVQERYHFYTKTSNVAVDLFFCSHQNDALTFAESNFPAVDGAPKTGVNGAVLFVVEGDDEYKVNNVLSWFAGEE